VHEAPLLVGGAVVGVLHDARAVGLGHPVDAQDLAAVAVAVAQTEEAVTGVDDLPSIRSNRAENSHQPTRQRERAMKSIRSVGAAQRFLPAFSGSHPTSDPAAT
jgi:hypothetical protein